MIFAALFAVLALAAVIGSRLWMLKKVKQAGRNDERPFNYEDELKNPYAQ